MRDYKNLGLGDMTEPVNFFRAVIWAGIIGAVFYGLAVLMLAAIWVRQTASMLRNKQWQNQWDHINSLTETGNYGCVGVGMIANLIKVIRSVYKAGYEDGKKSKTT